MFAERSTLCRLYNTLIFMQLLYVTRAFGVIFEEYVVDQGRNLTLRCDSRYPVRWVREGRREDARQFQTDGSLVLTNLTAQDSGRYTCSAVVPTLTTVTVLEETVPSGDDGDGTTNGTVGAAVRLDPAGTSSSENVTSESTTDGEEAEEEEDEEQEQEEERGKGPGPEDVQPEAFVELLKVNVKVRTPPLAVSNFYVRASTIIAVLVWEVMPNRTGGYAIRDFTAEMRRMRDPTSSSSSGTTAATDAPELPWETIDPRHISPNARQLEIYHLIPNTTYEFRIWGNNQLGAGEIVTILATTQPRMEEKDLVRRIMVDAKNFDTRVWIAAVGIVMGTLVILSLGTCIVLYKECREPAASDKDEELDSLELVPNIILNPGFCDSDDQGQHPLSPPVPRTLPYGHRYGHPGGYIAGGPPGHRLGAGGLLPNGSSYGGALAITTTSTNTTSNAGTGVGADDEDDDDDDEDEEPMTFSRRMSIFFTGNTIKRI